MDFMNREEMKNILPHREPMLLLDGVYLDEQGVARSRYEVRGDEFFLQGHFPGRPVVPGVILCEMMAQTCCILVGKINTLAYLTGIEKARFKNTVLPGDTIEFACTLKNRLGRFFFAKGEGHVRDKLCVSGEFSFVITPEEE